MQAPSVLDMEVRAECPGALAQYFTVIKLLHAMIYWSGILVTRRMQSIEGRA